MAKLALINREAKREGLVKKFKSRRVELLAQLSSPKVAEEDKDSLRVQLQKLPRNSSPTRLRNRCAITGRPRGVFKKFGLGRNKLREYAMRGEIPGMIKASW